MESCEDIPNPPSNNPSQYCRLCFSQFRVEPLFSDTSAQLPYIIASLVQIDLHPEVDARASICRMCREQITQFQLFRERSRLLDQSLKRIKPGNSSQALGVVKNEEFWLEVEPCEETTSDEEESNQNSIPQSSGKARESGPVGHGDQANASFWTAISVDVGAIPEHVSHSLEMAGFCRNTAMAMISSTTIRQIEQNMRDSVDLVVTQGASEGHSREVALRKYYGPLHCHNPTKFSFYAGEIQTILAIAAAVQENGITPYLKTAQTVPLPDVSSDSQYIEKLIKKIKGYYKDRNSGTESFKRFFATLPGPSNCEVEHTPEGNIYVRVGCTLCTAELRIRLKGGHFIYNNFIAHCHSRHYKTEAEFVRDRNVQANRKRKMMMEFSSVDGVEAE